MGIKSSSSSQSTSAPSTLPDERRAASVSASKRASDCRVCHYSKVMEFKGTFGRKIKALRCDYFDGFVYAPCDAFTYEPKTDNEERTG
jgi:hypothetical protein